MASWVNFFRGEFLEKTGKFPLIYSLFPPISPALGECDQVQNPRNSVHH